MAAENDTTGQSVPEDHYVYSYNDPKRSHIMSQGLSARGSNMWRTLDVKVGTQNWVERRDLSDRFLTLFKKNGRSGAPD